MFPPRKPCVIRDSGKDRAENGLFSVDSVQLQYILSLYTFSDFKYFSIYNKIFRMFWHPHFLLDDGSIVFLSECNPFRPNALNGAESVACLDICQGKV